MKGIFLVVLVLGVPALAAKSTIRSITGGEKIACAKLKLRYPEHTFFPGEASYTYETQSGKSW